MCRTRYLAQVVVTTGGSRSMASQFFLVFWRIVLQSRLRRSVDMGSYTHRVVYLASHMSTRLVRSDGVVLYTRGRVSNTFHCYTTEHPFTILQ